MKRIRSLKIFLIGFFSFLIFTLPLGAQTDRSAILATMHSISSNELFQYIEELASEKYKGRLSGTVEYDQAAAWVAENFKKWNLQPAGDDGFFQKFKNPYTLIFPGCELILHIPYKKVEIKKYYHFDDEFIPGSTSGSGEVTAEVIYVGYGITAPELGYDDYGRVDVKGKIVLLEREVPVNPKREPERFKKWRPYSFHQYKLQNAVKHGAVGMLYNYGPIANPNNAYFSDFIYTHVGKNVVQDIFAGTGKNHRRVVEKIKQKLKPQSFRTGKKVTIKNVTKHFPDGMTKNVLAILPGDDPEKRDEFIVIGAHLDHVGQCWQTMPGANDNASGIAVMLGLAKALAKFPGELKRSVLFIAFGAEEQAVAGSKFYLDHPVVPLEKSVCFLNLDGVGCGDSLRALAGRNFPELWNFIDQANQEFVHRFIRTSYFANIARPRLDAARFLWKGIPSISFSAYGAKSFYHNTHDRIETITPEILEDLAQILFISVVNIANAPETNFRK